MHNADDICLYVFCSENLQTHGKTSGAVNMFGMKISIMINVTRSSYVLIL